MSSRKELAGVRIDICSLREALHKIEHYIQEDGLHAVEAVSMKTVVTAGEEEEVRQCLEDIDLVIPSDKEILMELGVTSHKWLEEARDRHSIYLLTDTRAQMDELCSFLDHTYGDVARICGDAVWEECEEDTEQIVNEINAVAPHLLLVMLPTPQQEIFLAQHRKMLNVRLWFGVGTENTFTEKKKKTAGLCKRLLARRKMKRQIQSYEAEGEEKVN